MMESGFAFSRRLKRTSSLVIGPSIFHTGYGDVKVSGAGLERFLSELPLRGSLPLEVGDP